MKISKKLKVSPGKAPKLSHLDPGRTPGVGNKEAALERLEKNKEYISRSQDLLYAEGRRSVLVVLQGMDTSGKDGTIRHVFSGVNPQGCRVTSFKTPSMEELSHDYLWRIHRAAPPMGTVGIFNRSHYEDVLIVRVHGLVSRAVWSARYGQINAFEKMLAENGVTILKFFLHISKAEQERRLRERKENPEKGWKFNAGDLKERRYWDDYRRAYEEAIGRCATKWAPWYVIPSDKKWFRNFAVSEIMRETLARMKLSPGGPLSRRSA